MDLKQNRVPRDHLPFSSEGNQHRCTLFLAVLLLSPWRTDANATLAFSFCCHWWHKLSSRIAYLLVAKQARVALGRAVQEPYA